MHLKLPYRILFSLVLAIALIGCDSSSTPEKSNDALHAIELGGKTIELEIAISRESQQRGLMFRKSMPENQGMLFIFPAPQQMSFWMRNTSLPLDIGYFTDDGVLREIYQLHPHDENSRKSHRSDLVYALEMNQGWFKANGIKAGDSFDPDSL